MTTCARSEPTRSSEISASFPTSSSEAPPVRSIPRSIVEAGGSMATTSSSTRSGSSMSADHVGRLLRTALGYELAAMTGSPVRWKRSATPAGRLWFNASGRAIDADDPSSLLPTCRAHKGGLPDSHGNTSMWGALLISEPGASLAEIGERLGLSGRQILAAMYENMMGFPPGFLSNAVKPTATPSSPN